MNLVVIGDIHTQHEKLWRMLQDAGLADSQHAPTDSLRDPDTKLILLGDLVHAKSRQRYSQLAGVRRYDERNSKHLSSVEAAQETMLWEIKTFAEAVPEGQVTILMGNHDYNVITPEQGALRSDNVAHLEWHEPGNSRLNPDLRTWIASWPYEQVIEGIHFAHVGPLEEHNRYDESFYLENRRRWIYEDKDYLEDTDYRIGIYGHTPVRGGVNLASRGRAILLDTNGYRHEACYLTINIEQRHYHIRMQGLFFDELVPR
ncbi:MAG: metallophosphoesterase [Deinococcota bacterium]